MSVLLHNPRCRKSREALELLNEKGVMVEVVEYLKTPLAKDEIAELADKLGVQPEMMIRKGESVFKEEYKGKELSSEDYIQMMADHPILIERPVFIKDNKAIIGRPPERVLELL